MTSNGETAGIHLIQALNDDIARELSLARKYVALSLAEGHRSTAFRRRCAATAAEAMRHATALAAEVMHLGGVPSTGTQRRSVAHPAEPAPDSDRFAHYRQRLRMANELGLLRLEEVLEEILRDLRGSSQKCGLIFRPIWIT